MMQDINIREIYFCHKFSVNPKPPSPKKKKKLRAARTSAFAFRPWRRGYEVETGNGSPQRRQRRPQQTRWFLAKPSCLLGGEPQVPSFSSPKRPGSSWRLPGFSRASRRSHLPPGGRRRYRGTLDARLYGRSSLLLLLGEVLVLKVLAANTKKKRAEKTKGTERREGTVASPWPQRRPSSSPAPPQPSHSHPGRRPGSGGPGAPCEPPAAPASAGSIA